jgi:hypothetical protein
VDFSRGSEDPYKPTSPAAPRRGFALHERTRNGRAVPPRVARQDKRTQSLVTFDEIIALLFSRAMGIDDQLYGMLLIEFLGSEWHMY